MNHDATSQHRCADRRIESRIKRRRFLLGVTAGVAGVLAAPLLPGRRAFAADVPRVATAGPKVASAHGALLEASPLVYVSPLKSDGSESRCHAEVWYAWLNGGVVMTVASDRWKARAIGRGLERARIWVGDHGRASGVLGANAGFLAAPNFYARGEKVADPALLEQLLAAYDQKYPGEIDRWRDAMRKGQADGSRVLLRYAPD